MKRYNSLLKASSKSLSPCLEQRAFTALLLFFLSAGSCFGSVTLLVEEPYGTFGAYNPTGHAAVFLDHVCAESYTKLRHCSPGESGIVLSRYLRIHNNDWLAVPLVPYLYAVDYLNEVPQTVNRTQVDTIRKQYWATHLKELAPPDPDGSAPRGIKRGLWVGLVGAAYDRTIHGYQIDSTWEQDEALIQTLNASRNGAKYNLLFHNCADFAKEVLGYYMPLKIHRNFIGDLGILTPKRVGAAFVKYGKRQDEAHFTVFSIPQVSGKIPRSYPVNGVAESLVKSKRYIIPLVLINPTLAFAAAIGYLTEAHIRLPSNAPAIDIRKLTGQSDVHLQEATLSPKETIRGIMIQPSQSKLEPPEKEPGS